MKRQIIATFILLILLVGTISTNVWAKTVTLSWDASPSNVSGYKIYYGTESTGSWNGSGATEGDSPLLVGDVLTYVIHDLPDDMDHYFAVTAYDDSDNESTYSNIVHSPVISHSNTPPVLAPIGDYSISEGATLHFNLTATDADGDPLTYTASNLPNGAGIDAATGDFSWTPTFDQSQIYAVTFSVSDGESVDTETINITVADVALNRAPELSAIGNKAVSEGETQYIPVSATDPDGDNLVYSVTNLPSGATFDAANRIFTWPTNFDQAGIYSLTFYVSDGTLTDSEQISITINNVNRPPVLNSVGTQTVGEGERLSFTVSGVDSDGDALDYSAQNLPSGATFDPLQRLFSWTPSFEASTNTRVYPVTFTVSDGSAEDSETITLNVTNVNRAPVLDAIGTQVITEGDSVNLVVNASDPDNNPLTYSASGLPAGAVFTAETFSFNWIPGNEQSGSYQVKFVVSDGSLSDSETVTFTVNNGNEPPVFSAIGAQSVEENSPLSFVVVASDSNGDSLSYSVQGLPDGAVFDESQRRFSWTPDYTQAGSFTVVFKASDGTLSDAETVEITVTNNNRSPVVSGNPNGSAMATARYSFTPVASDPDGDPLIFSITNKPSWADFSTATGELSGTPTAAQVGTSSDILISVSDSISTMSLSPFSIEVLAYVQQDSDGDGILDHLDAFPDDNSEWLDTDGDQIGNNSDLDDDNDGIADVRDGFPLDSTQSGWVISATAGTGGYLTPEGDTAVLYGGSQGYQLTPMSGYYIHDLLVDNVSVGTVDRYEFENIGAHHTITAVFATIPTGLSYNPISSGLIGVERVDGGDDSNNLVDNKPKQNLDYQFKVVLRDSVPADQRRVFLILDQYKYEMEFDSGLLSSGADYVLTARLGPAFSHSFHFSAEDSSGNHIWRYPASGDLPGPVVSLLNGKNVVGLAAKINAYALTATEAFNDSQIYRWVPQSEISGHFELVDIGAPIATGEGYVLKNTRQSSLPNFSLYGDISEATHEFQVHSGWNLISNPYGGNVSLADIEIRLGDADPVPWLTAVADNLVVDVIYSYLGADWDNGNEFASAAGSKSAILVPWVGYWIYVNPTDQEASLIILKPLQD
ncbi:Putative Ig domain-containing protein [Desulfuromusa kysingii]|uniref:Putative Ig domain-containing protein n=1 Tax=Desulfuromusa kysingii TaxID=37625 RepID=A0A1H3Y7K8_9BACT|nr:putative Ig domain-containing protein [Desulfuromusa kysingii]SEA06862.1 Putative Ig domain-containing protein [Desulfuromusa kysingii]